MSKSGRVVVMARPPIAGKVKTRLAVSLGNDNTLRVYEILLKHTINFLEKSDYDVYWFWSEAFEGRANASFHHFVQNGEDLGERMESAFAKMFHDSLSEVIMIGTDCFELDEIRLGEAFEALSRCDVVLGPASDGGYYLIGMRSLHEGLFHEMPWSTSQLMECSIQHLREQQLSFVLLPMLSDIDEVVDLKHPSFSEYMR